MELEESIKLLKEMQYNCKKHKKDIDLKIKKVDMRNL